MIRFLLSFFLLATFVDAVARPRLDVDGDTSADHAETAAPTIRFGRLQVDNAAGAEVAPIALPVRATVPSVRCRFCR